MPESKESVSQTTASSKTILNYPKEKLLSIQKSQHSLTRPSLLSREFDDKRGLFCPDKWVQHIWQTEGMDNKIVIYTDCSCYRNKVGAGIYVEHGHTLNLSTILEGTESSTQGEIRAARVALELIRRWPSYRHQHVVLCTDDIYLVKTLRRGPPFVCAYKRDMENLYKAATSFPNGVTVKHVFGHKGNFGNEEADSMARSALNLSRRSSRSPPELTYPEINERAQIRPANNWEQLFHGTNSKIEMYDGDDKIF
ncbi:RNase H domain-containing protein [Ditylenchus destructor]|nr:RNase H domain-containing protein [Ditylenchus destructor]